MAQDMFIKFDGIEGEAHDDFHGNEIQVLAWHWDVSQNSSMHSGSGGGSGKATVSDFYFEHYCDKSTPNLTKYCLNGKHIRNVQFVIRKAGGTPLEYLKMSFSDVIITSVDISGSLTDEEHPLEAVRFSFSAVCQDYVLQNRAGGQTGNVSFCYDVKANSENVTISGHR